MEHSQCNCPNCPARFKKTVLIVRDGRSALCSYYKFQSSLNNFKGTFSDFLRDADASHYGRSWGGWYGSWVNASAAGDVQFVGSSFPNLNLIAKGGADTEGGEVYVLR